MFWDVIIKVDFWNTNFSEFWLKISSVRLGFAISAASPSKVWGVPLKDDSCLCHFSRSQYLRGRLGAKFYEYKINILPLREMTSTSPSSTFYDFERQKKMQIPSCFRTHRKRVRCKNIFEASFRGESNKIIPVPPTSFFRRKQLNRHTMWGN